MGDNLMKKMPLFSRNSKIVIYSLFIFAIFAGCFWAVQTGRIDINNVKAAVMQTNDIDFVPLKQQRDLSTPSSRLVSHTPSLEETVRNESKNIKNVQIMKNQVRRRTLTNLQGVHVIVDSGYANQNLLDKDQVRTDVELKLRYAGINVLSKEQCLRTKGRPSLLLNAFVLPSQWDSFLAAVKSLELYEQVSLERNPDVTLYLATWEGGVKSSFEDELRTAVKVARQEIKSLVEHFVDDYYSINLAPPNEHPRPEVLSTFTEAGGKYSSVALKGLVEIHVPQLYRCPVISVKTNIIPQLEKAGITVLSSEQWNEVQDGDYPKTPYLFLEAFHLGDDPKCFKGVFPLKLIDRVILTRNPEIIRELPVWESKLGLETGDMRHKDEVLREVRQDVQDMVDEFINAYLSVKSKDI